MITQAHHQSFDSLHRQLQLHPFEVTLVWKTKVSRSALEVCFMVDAVPNHLVVSPSCHASPQSKYQLTLEGFM